MSADTEDTFVPRQFADSFFAEPSPPVQWALAAATHCGLVRSNNEDHFFVSRRARSHDVLWTNLPNESVRSFVDEDFLMLVADGVGGDAFGEVASRLVLQSLWELTSLATSWSMKFVDFQTQEFQERIHAYVDRIDQQLKRAAQRNPRVRGAATTLTGAHLMGRDVVVANIGDSRAYVCRNDGCRQITRDHTVGRLLPDTRRSPGPFMRLQHVLMNYLSMKPESRAVPELHHERLEDGDVLLLCTDGLTNMLDDDHIARIINNQPHVQAACDALIAAALASGGEDNVTLALAQLRVSNPPDEDEAPSKH